VKKSDTGKSLELAKELIVHGCDLDMDDDGDIGRSASYFHDRRPKTPNREQFVDLLVGKGADKRAIKGKYPEKARDYPAREERPSSERRERTSSLSRKLSF
jgi:hypothetical protein